MVRLSFRQLEWSVTRFVLFKVPEYLVVGVLVINAGLRVVTIGDHVFLVLDLLKQAGLVVLLFTRPFDSNAELKHAAGDGQRWSSNLLELFYVVEVFTRRVDGTSFQIGDRGRRDGWRMVH